MSRSNHNILVKGDYRAIAGMHSATRMNLVVGLSDSYGMYGEGWHAKYQSFKLLYFGEG
jgi:hypothetical protein